VRARRHQRVAARGASASSLYHPMPWSKAYVVSWSNGMPWRLTRRKPSHPATYAGRDLALVVGHRWVVGGEIVQGHITTLEADVAAAGVVPGQQPAGRRLLRDDDPGPAAGVRRPVEKRGSPLYRSFNTAQPAPLRGSRRLGLGLPALSSATSVWSCWWAFATGLGVG
jgi:hypothetical protein